MSGEPSEYTRTVSTTGGSVSTLHERLLAMLSPSDRGRRAVALRAVVERHAPVPRSPLDGGGFSCPVCVEYCSELGEHTCSRGNVEAPCDEIRAIAEALGVDGD